MEPSGAQKRGSSAGIFVKMSIFNLKRRLAEKMCELLLCVPGDFLLERELALRTMQQHKSPFPS